MQVLLQFAIDDTAGGENEDALTEIGFYVPKEAASFQDGQEHPAKVGVTADFFCRTSMKSCKCPLLVAVVVPLLLYLPNLLSTHDIGLADMQVLHDMIMPHTDSGAAVGDAIASFGAVAVLAPRGRFEIELYGSFMKLLGQVRQRAWLLDTSLPCLRQAGLCISSPCVH